MLKSLSIKNYALIESLMMEPGNGLNIITGETGAGKSIMLGALGLIIGKRADTKVLLDEDRKCVVEATFDVSAYELQELYQLHDLDYHEETIIRREIAPSGRSRAFVNDSPANLDALKELGERLIDIHSQHDTLLLRDDRAQTAILDSYAQNAQLLHRYRKIFSSHRKVERELDRLKQQSADAKSDLDYRQFLLDELQKANLSTGEKDSLEEELSLIENSEEIRERLGAALEGLSNGEMNVCGWLKDVTAQLKALKGMGKNFATLHERLESALIELEDVSHELSGEEQRIDVDQERGQEVKERVDLINTLESKHHVSGTEALLSVQQKLEQEMSDTLDLDSQIEEAEQEVNSLITELNSLAGELTANRTAAIQPLKEKAEELLHQLGMPGARLKVDLVQGRLTDSGTDKVTFLFSANKGIREQPLREVASGGEFSRLMLSIKYLMAERTALPTIILDEIDTGISGEVAFKTGRLLRQMSGNHQLIAITHLPQIAASGQYHYFVYKDENQDRSVSRLRQLSKDERITEIAQMMSGQPPTAAALQNAEELLTTN